MGHINVEIKARCDDPTKVINLLLSNGASYKGDDHQTDVYFGVVPGRLKLRKSPRDNCLIHYYRENLLGPKKSDVTLFPVKSGKSLVNSLEKILAKVNGKLVTVKKIRKVYVKDNVEFYIDDVDQLGSFVEIEARDVSGTIGEEKLTEQCNHYMKLLNISQEDLIPGSYADMLLNIKPA